MKHLFTIILLFASVVGLSQTTRYGTGASASGTDNSNFGYYSGAALQSSGNYNNNFGYMSGRSLTTGDHNTNIGRKSGYSNKTGYDNTNLGNSAGYSNSSGDKNTYIGVHAGFSNLSSNNTMIGYRSGKNSSGSGNVFLGHDAGYNETGSNRLYIDNTNTSSPLIWGDFSGNKLNFNANVGIGTTSPSYPLHVIRANSSSWQGRFQNGSSNVYFAHGGGYGIHINTGGSNSSGRYALEVRNSSQTHFYVRDDGNVGIGVTAPSDKLDVNGTARIRSLSANNALTQVVVADANGKLHYREVSTISGGSNANEVSYDNSTSGLLATNSQQAIDELAQGNFWKETASNEITLAQGKIGVNTAVIPSDFELAVGGAIIAERVQVIVSENWPDYVFENSYELQSLKSVEQFIQKNHHLPNIPSESKVRDEGIDIGEMNIALLRKVEELTLHLINQNRQIEELVDRVKLLEGENN